MVMRMPVQKSDVFSEVIIADVLGNAPLEMGVHMNWVADRKNPFQCTVFEFWDGALALAKLLRERGQLRSKASDTADVINGFLSDEGFDDLHLRDLMTKGALYLASVTELQGNFMKKGQKGYRLKNLGKFGFRLGSDAGVVHFMYNGQKVIGVPTDGGFWLMVTAQTGKRGHLMVKDWYDIVSGMKIDTSGNGVVLPKVMIKNLPIDVSGLKDLASDPWWIAQALAAAKLTISEAEVDFKSAVAVSVQRGGGKVDERFPEQGDHLVDYPPYIALVKPGYILSLASGNISPSDTYNSVEH